MAESDLLFWKLADGSADLIYGDTADPIVQHVEASLDDTLPGLTFEAKEIPNTNATVSYTFPGMEFAAAGAYVSRAARPVVGKVETSHQLAASVESGATASHQQAEPVKPGASTSWQQGDGLVATTVAPFSKADQGPRNVNTSRYETGVKVGGGYASSFENASRTSRNTTLSAFRDATRHISRTVKAAHQDADRSPRSASRTSYQTAVGRAHSSTHYFGRGRRALGYRTSAYQEGVPPPAGMWTRPVPPVVPPLDYTADLLFAKLRDGSAALIFNDYGTPPTPSGTVVIPVRSVYMVINEVSLKRVSNNLALPSASFSLRIDYGSWTWGFSASLPATALPDLEPDSQGNPVALEATINGTPYRVLVESITRERTFGSVPTISVSGRGISAQLDAPYAAIRNFTNSEARTAQQLMNDALTINGVSIGWTVDWQMTDWLVPAGAWAHQGTYISALKAISEAAGGYILPHARDAILRIKPRYPVAPWKWATEVTPDYELPSALTTREGIEWLEKPRYNAIYVSGANQGVLGRVIRQGTAADDLAQMVVDPLITHVDAARQRGISILSETGRIANVSLRVPVLPELGIIEPGKFIKYTDGGEERLGIVRSNDIAVGYPEVFQSIGVETHVAP